MPESARSDRVSLICRLRSMQSSPRYRSQLAAETAEGSMQSSPRYRSQLAAEIASAKRAMINPVAIPSTRAYIRDARAVADEKGCPPDA